MPVLPISPSEALRKKFIPELVLSVVNELLEERAGQTVITLYRHEVVTNYLNKREEAEGSINVYAAERELIERHWLDFEQKYRDVGWEVKYHQPDYSEDYCPFWTFKSVK